MGRLTDLLRNPKINESTIKTVETNVRNSNIFQSINGEISDVEDNDGQMDLIFDLTEDEIEEIRNSVIDIDTTGKDRREIIIGMFGGIKNPKNGKRFVIPTIDFDTEDYTYQYAKCMQMLVNRPEEFKKIMNWE